MAYEEYQDGVKMKSSHKTPPYIMVRQNIEAVPITSRQRTGRAFLVDTFEDYTAVITEKWRQLTGTIALDTDYPKQGKSCMSLTTAAGVGETANTTFYIGAFPKSRFGIEFEFQCGETVTNITSFLCQILYYDGTQYIQTHVKWLGTNQLKWQYYSSAGAYIDISSGDQELDFVATDQPLYNNLKFVADMKNEEYVKLICNEKEFDLSGIAARTGADASAPRLAVTLVVTNAVIGARTLRVDNVILTDEEP